MGSPASLVIDRYRERAWGHEIGKGAPVLRSLACKLFGHKIDRHRVWNDGIDFRTRCARCIRPMLRGQSGWREYDDERDGDPDRTPHPKHDEG